MRRDGLTEAEVAQYRDNGYVVVRGLFSPQEVEAFDRRFEALVVEGADLPEGMQIMRDVMVVKGAVSPESPAHGVNKLFCFEEDAELMRYTSHEALLTCLTDLLGPSVYSASTNIFNKPPGVDGRHPFHQDLRYYKIRPADKIVGTWTAIHPANRQRGCLAVIPESHRLGLLPHAYPDWEYVNHGFYAVEDIGFDKRVYVELEPGDTLLFHPLLVHGSGRNRSEGFRRAASAHFVAGDANSEGKPWKDNPLVRKVR